MRIAPSRLELSRIGTLRHSNLRMAYWSTPHQSHTKRPGDLGTQGHQISVIDIDKRDLDLHVLVGNLDYIPFDIDLDPAVDCRDKCLELNFSAVVVVVPPGRHTVNVEIRKCK